MIVCVFRASPSQGGQKRERRKELGGYQRSPLAPHASPESVKKFCGVGHKVVHEENCFWERDRTQDLGKTKKGVTGLPLKRVLASHAGIASESPAIVPGSNAIFLVGLSSAKHQYVSGALVYHGSSPTISWERGASHRIVDRGVIRHDSAPTRGDLGGSQKCLSSVLG